MKTLLKILFMLSLLNISVIPQGVNFDKDYTSLGATSEGYTVEQTSNGNYIVSGEADSKLIFMKTDSLGNMLFTKDIAKSNYFPYIKTLPIEPTSDGGFIITNGSDTKDRTELRFIRLNSEGNTLWERSYQDSFSVLGTDIVETSEGHFLSIGIIERNKLLLSKVDNNGNLIWLKFLELPPDGHLSNGPSIIKLQDGHFLIGHYKHLIKTNSDGDILWESNSSFIISSIKNTIDGQIVVSEGGRFTKFDLEGNKLWEKNVSKPIDCITNTLDGYFYTIQSGSILSKYDSLGNFKWNRNIEDICNFLSATRDSGIVLTGHFQNNLRIIKTLENGFFQTIHILDTGTFTEVLRFSKIYIRWYSKGIENVDIE
jgi:hypothetical protein